MLSLIEPNIHPILVHFAFALSITSTGLYVLAKVGVVSSRLPAIRQSADLILGLAVLSVVFTVAAGFQAYFTVGHDGPSHDAMTVHRNWALGASAFLLSAAAWRWIKRAAEPSLAFVGAMLISAILFTTTAWWGGHIVYGFGLGVKQLPAISGPGHDHHGSSGGHDHGAEMDSHEEMPVVERSHSHGESSAPHVDKPNVTDEQPTQSKDEEVSAPHDHDGHAH
ncbi:MAG: DUF2231 domain-containing protein [Alphaproteobacteria bacterium]